MLMHLEDSDDYYCVDIDFEPYPRVPGSSGFCSQLPPRSLRSSLFLHTLLSRYRACHSQEALWDEPRTFYFNLLLTNQLPVLTNQNPECFPRFNLPPECWFIYRRRISEYPQQSCLSNSDLFQMQIMKPSDMSPISSHERSGYNRSWDNISPVSKPPDSETHDQYNKFPSSEYSTPSAATKYAETRENRIDSFTKAFTDTISKAMMSELNMSLESATKTDSNPESHPSPLKPADPAPAPSLKPDSLLSPKHKPKDIPDIKKSEPAARPRSPGARPRSPGARPRSPGARPRSPGARPRSPGAKPRSPGARPRSPEAVRKPELKTSEVPKRGEGKVPEPRRVEHTAVNKGRKSISGTESNSSVASLKHPPQR